MAFLNREEAGKKLAQRLQSLDLKNPIVIALPRGGVPVGAIIAETLNLPLEVLVIRKVGAPGNPEYAIGAVTEGDLFGLNPEAVEALGMTHQQLQKAIAQGVKQVRATVQRYRNNEPLISV